MPVARPAATPGVSHWNQLAVRAMATAATDLAAAVSSSVASITRRL